MGETVPVRDEVAHVLLRDGVAVSYTSLRRYVREAERWKPAHETLRMADWPPGEVAEIDFGKLGSSVGLATGKRQSVWAFLIVLSASPGPCSSRRSPRAIAGLEAACQSFGGVPKRLILENFAAAIAGPDALEPRPTRGFIEYSQARGFLCAPARMRKSKDKPHVARGIQYLRERFFKGGGFRSLADCREQAERWCRDVAGLRVHGTTRQLPP